MRIFWDASAVVPLLLTETKQSLAQEIWKKGEQFLAWDWLSVEVESALTRRQASPSVWRNWRGVHSAFDWISLEATDLKSLRAMNQGLGLRAADAGHVFVFEMVSHILPDLQMATFDLEMSAAVRKLDLRLHPACE